MTIPTGPSAGHGHNLLGPQPTLLPADPDATDRLDAGEDPAAVAADHPTSSAAWATLAEQALDAGATITAYAYARTGYHRGLDQLRRNGWAGFGPVPWEHVPNRGFLSCLGLLALAAKSIGETEEWERCRDFLRDSSPTGYDVLFAGIEE
jgi:hypothetical protein